MNLEEITALESGYVRDGQPTLGLAYEQLRLRWDSAVRDRETSFRLLFLSWYTCSEPTWLTGLPNGVDTRSLFRQIAAHLLESDPRDPEFLFVAGYMAYVLPYCCGDDDEWAEWGSNRLEGYRLTGRTLTPEDFDARTAYGEYFAHIVRSGWHE